MTPDEVEQHVSSTRRAWLKMLQVCLTELGFDESVVTELTIKLDSLNPKRQLRVTKIKKIGDTVLLYGDDPSFAIEVPRPHAGKPLDIGEMITYVRDGPNHGWLVRDTEA